MGEDEPQPDQTDAVAKPDGLSRRALIAAGAASAVVGVGVGVGRTAFALRRDPPALWQRPSLFGAQRVGGLHVQFGSDASTHIVVSWHTTDPVRDPRVLLGTPRGGFGG